MARPLFSTLRSAWPDPGLPRRAAPRAALVCVAVAVLLWVMLTLRKPARATFTAPLTVTSVARGRGLVEAPPERVAVTVEGTGFRLLPLLADPPTLTLGAQADAVSLADALGGLTPSVRLVSVRPGTLNLRTGPLVTRRLPVRLMGHLGFAPTFALVDSVRLFPDSVTVTGAEAVLDGLAAWPTEDVVVGNVRDTLRLDVPLRDTLGMLVRRPTRVVRLVVPVGAFAGVQREVEVRVRGVPAGAPPLVPDPSTLQVRFLVRLGQVEAAMRATDFFAEVQYEALRAAPAGRVFPRLNLPAGLTLRDVVVTPRTVGYYVRAQAPAPPRASASGPPAAR